MSDNDSAGTPCPCPGSTSTESVEKRKEELLVKSERKTNDVDAVAVNRCTGCVEDGSNKETTDFSQDYSTELQPETVSALLDFLKDREKEKERQPNLEELTEIPEDWQLSQFWYDNETAEVLAKQVVHLAGSNGSIACIACPTVYITIRKLYPDIDFKNVKLFEFDRRFSFYTDSFVFYDFNEPTEINSSGGEGGGGGEKMLKKFDVVIADPPFLSKDCLSKISDTIKLISKDYIILCTGSVMSEHVQDLLGLHECEFVPKHKNNLANEFSCFANFELDVSITHHTNPVHVAEPS